MSSIVEWVDSVDKNTRGKPNKQIQKELFTKIYEALEEGSNTFEECVTAFCRFDAKVLEPFYEEYYWCFSEEWKSEWDKAIISWANSKKPTDPATIRIIMILSNKLTHTGSVESVLQELKWLSLHEDKKTDGCIKALRDNGNLVLLSTLLNLDMSDWNIGQVQISKMFSMLFSGSNDPDIAKNYQEFLNRNHLPGSEASASIVPKVESVQETVDASVEKTDKEKGQVNLVTKEKPKATTLPQDGEAMAEALLNWVKTSKAQNMAQAVTISDQKLTIKKLTEENEKLSDEIEALENAALANRKEKANMEKELSEAHSDIATLREEKAEAEDTIGRVQVMSGNSVKQELDGFKHELAGELKKTVKDFRSDVSDISDVEKAELYKALLEEMIDTLKHHDIAVEEE